jgi:hypothetical protein
MTTNHPRHVGYVGSKTLILTDRMNTPQSVDAKLTVVGRSTVSASSLGCWMAVFSAGHEGVQRRMFKWYNRTVSYTRVAKKCPIILFQRVVVHMATSRYHGRQKPPGSENARYDGLGSFNVWLLVHKTADDYGLWLTRYCGKTFRVLQV